MKGWMPKKASYKRLCTSARGEQKNQFPGPSRSTPGTGLTGTGTGTGSKFRDPVETGSGSGYRKFGTRTGPGTRFKINFFYKKSIYTSTY